MNFNTVKSNNIKKNNIKKTQNNSPSNTVFINVNMMTNFKPKIFNITDNHSYLNIKRTKNFNKIFCKNFFTYVLLLKYNNIFENNSIFIKKKRKKVLTILRAPYRYKLARHQININRYFLNISFKVKMNNTINIKSWRHMIIFFNFLKRFSGLFESNLIFLNNINISTPLKYSCNFVYFY